MSQIEGKPQAERFLSVKETACLLRISPKTIYNRLWRGDFPLEPVQLPWDGRGLYFRTSDVVAMAATGRPPDASTIRRLLDSLPGPPRPVRVATMGVDDFRENHCGRPLIEFKRLEPGGLGGWAREHELLLFKRRRAVICLAADSAEHYRAASLLGAVVAVEMGRV